MLNKIKTYLKYSPEMGVFTWIKSERDGWIGKQAGHLHSSGYTHINFKGKIFKGHRLAWFYMTGEYPKETIDHKNRIKSDNRWINLRKATMSQQNGNQYLHSKNSSGFRGVTWNKRDKVWRAQITIGNKIKYLGSFKSKEEAALKYKIVAKEYFKEFYNEKQEKRKR